MIELVGWLVGWLIGWLTGLCACDDRHRLRPLQSVSSTPHTYIYMHAPDVGPQLGEGLHGRGLERLQLLAGEPELCLCSGMYWVEPWCGDTWMD